MRPRNQPGEGRAKNEGFSGALLLKATPRALPWLSGHCTYFSSHTASSCAILGTSPLPTPIFVGETSFHTSVTIHIFFV